MTRTPYQFMIATIADEPAGGSAGSAGPAGLSATYAPANPAAAGAPSGIAK